MEETGQSSWVEAVAPRGELQTAPIKLKTLGPGGSSRRQPSVSPASRAAARVP